MMRTPFSSSPNENGNEITKKKKKKTQNTKQQKTVSRIRTAKKNPPILVLFILFIQSFYPTLSWGKKKPCSKKDVQLCNKKRE